MSFLAPLFFLGALAVALPVIFHLIRRNVKEKTIFSSLMFLGPSTPRLTRRSRFEHLLLLALRCAVLCLLAFGFARPFFKQAVPQSQAVEPAKRVMVLLDTSASMRRQELWDAAKAKAEEIARGASPADALALFTFDRQFKPLITFDQWNETAAGGRLALVRGRLSDISPGWAGTALDDALAQAAELVGDVAKDESEGLRQIIVISDFQEGSRITGLQRYQWPGGVQVSQERILPRSANNASLQLLGETMGAAVTAEPVVRVRISNAPDSKQEQFKVGWAGANGGYLDKPVEVYTPAGQSRIVSMVPPSGSISTALDRERKNLSGSTSVATGQGSRIILTGDDEPFDNAVWVIPPGSSQVTVIYMGEDLEGDARHPLFYLRHALQDTPRQTFRVVRADPSAPLSRELADSASMVVVTGNVDDAQAEHLRDLLFRGGTLLMLPVNTQAAGGISKILEIDLPPAGEQRPDGYAMLAEIDFADPLFAPFADARFSDFTKLHFWSYRKMDFEALPNARTLARFDTGDPAIVSISVGKGRVVVFTSGWHPADSQLALSSKFVPLLYSLIEISGAAPPATPQHFVGDTLPVPQPVATAATTLTLQMPHGSKAELKPGETGFVASEPGIYTVVSPRETARFAVNLEPSESRTGPMALDELERLGVPGTALSPPVASDSKSKMRLRNAELEARQKLWRWLIVATLVVLGVETWLAGHTTRREELREELS